jgi:DNA-binding transcriptional regulator YiaG
MSAALAPLIKVRAACTSGEAERLRVEAGVRRAEMARRCGVNSSTILRWEEGSRTPRGGAAARYWAALEEIRRAQAEMGSVG